MNRVSRKVPAYTSLDDVQGLSSGTQMAIQAVIDNNTGAENVTVAIEHSADGRVFTQKSTTPEINHASLVQRTVYGYEAAPRKPSLKYVRLSVLIDGSSAHVVVTVSVRGSPVRKEKPAPPPRNLLLAAPAGSHERTVAMTRDFTALAEEAKHLAPLQRAAHVLQNLSPESREHLRALDRRILATPPEIRTKMIGAVAQFMRTAVELARTNQTPEGMSTGSCCDGPPKSCTGGC